MTHPRTAGFNAARPLLRPKLNLGDFTPALIDVLNAFADGAGVPQIGSSFWDDVPVAAPRPPVPTTTYLADPTAFFNHMRGTRTLGPVLTTDEVNGGNAIIQACGDAGWPIADVAYALATAYHETAGTMRPIPEYGKGRGRRYGVPGPHGGQVAYGRGYVQLTWPVNYAKADAKLGLGGSLIANYERALEPEIAAKIMVRGMREGWFTSKDLDDDLPREGVATLDQFIRSRDIINGTDKAEKIAREAIDFQGGLVAGGWRERA